jgi:hypothetical protein
MTHKILLAVLVVGVLGSCSPDCNEQLKKMYAKYQKELSQSQTVNGFKLTMSFIPAQMLPKAGDIDSGKDSAAFYYFKLQVECPPPDAKSNAVSLNYGLDSLFSTTGNDLTLPVLVEPVVTGRRQFYEYLLVFPKDAFRELNGMRIFFLDRLFTNTRLAFEFDRSIIDKIETLPCYATKA